MAENTVKIKKILEAGKVVYPATILDAVKDAKSVKVEGVETNKWYGKTLREILDNQAEGASAEVKELENKLYGTPAVGVEGEEGYVPAVEGELPAIKGRLDVIEGDAKTEGSIKKAAADAVADVVAGAPDSFDTLKEIAEWISKDAENEDAFDAANRIVNLETTVGTPSVAATEDSEAIVGTGLTKRIEDLEKVNATRDLTTADVAVEGQYVSSVSQNADGTIVVSREDLPVLSVKDGSSDFVAVVDHEVEIKTSTLEGVGLSKGEDGKYVAGEANEAKGLAVAADVAAELVNDEEVMAAALNDLNDRLSVFEDGENSVEKQIENAIDALDVEETTAGDGNVTVTYSEEDGKVAISEVAVAEATAVFTAAVEAAEGVEAAPAKLEVPAADAAKLLNAVSVAAIKDYVDDHFSTEDCSDTADYDDVF